jgi:hypothetical protein
MVKFRGRPPAARILRERIKGGSGMNSMYIETTTHSQPAPRVEFTWETEEGQPFGRLVAHNAEQHTYLEVNLDPETARRIAQAILAGPPRG